jgi:subtilisin family serine protease
MNRYVKKSALAIGLTLAAGVAFGQSGNGNGAEAKLRALDSGKRVHDSYIVVLNEGAMGASVFAEQAARSQNLDVQHVFSRALNGFSVRMTEAQARALARNPNVAYIEADQEVALVATQSPATWGLDRVDQRNLPLNNAYTFNFSGTGVNVYIIDTGIRASHVDFSGRVVSGFTAINDGNGTNDCNGHGTHVAGTAGGETYGVAKDATLYAVRVLGCNGSGTNAGVIAGVDFVANQQSSQAKAAVANMSLGGGASSALDAAVNNATAAGVLFVAAAGNDNANACNSSPARAATAYTVGSTTSSDARSSFSNFGTCLNIFAPGSSITSAWSTSNTATNTISGTSMAAPHVAGAAALLVEENPTWTVAQVRAALTDNATPNVISNVGSGSPNLLLYTLTAGGGGGTPPPPPGGQTVFSANFDAGTATGWNKSSSSADLWRLSSDCAPAASGTFKLAFNRASPNCTYSNGARVTGWVRSPQINLSGFSTATLKFSSRRQVESFNGEFDIMRVEASSNNGSSWTTIAQWDSSDAATNGFVTETLDVSSFATSQFRVRFFFDSVDGTANSFLGWLIDDVEVTAQ